MFFPSSGPTLTADHMNPDEIYHRYSTSRLKQEPYEASMHVHSGAPKVYTNLPPHVPKDNKPVSPPVQHNTEGAEGRQAVLALTCSVLGEGERGRRPLSMGRSELCVREDPHSHPATRHPQPADSFLQRPAASQLQPCSEEEDRRMMGRSAHTPYVSLSCHKLVRKHGSSKEQSFTTQSHTTGRQSYHSNKTVAHSCSSRSQSSALSDSVSESPRYFGTSVIITHER